MLDIGHAVVADDDPSALIAIVLVQPLQLAIDLRHDATALRGGRTVVVHMEIRVRKLRKDEAGRTRAGIQRGLQYRIIRQFGDRIHEEGVRHPRLDENIEQAFDPTGTGQMDRLLVLRHAQLRQQGKRHETNGSMGDLRFRLTTHLGAELGHWPFHQASAQETPQSGQRHPIQQAVNRPRATLQP